MTAPETLPAMKAMPLTFVCAALLGGCGGASRQAHVNAAANVALAATVMAVQAATTTPPPPPDRPSLGNGPLYEKGRTPCVRNTSYGMYCTMDDERCFFRTTYGKEFTCATRNCADGPPAPLARWCDGDE